MKCGELASFVEACLDAYVDGELDDRECGELEAHLAQCERCNEAVRSHARLKTLVRQRGSTIRAPEHLADRLAACLDAVDEESLSARHDDLLDEDSAPPDIVPSAPERGNLGPPFHQVIPRFPAPAWRSMPVFASVAFLLVFVWMASGGFAHDPLIDDTVRKHARGLPLEVTGPADSLQRWMKDKVDFNPGVLVFPTGLEPLGARLSHVRDHPAVYVGYGRPGSGPDGERRASLFVFCDPSFDPATERHHRRRMGDRNMIVTSRNGFTVVLWKEAEMVYSFVSDLEEREILALIQAATNR